MQAQLKAPVIMQPYGYMNKGPRIWKEALSKRKGSPHNCVDRMFFSFLVVVLSRNTTAHMSGLSGRGKGGTGMETLWKAVARTNCPSYPKLFVQSL